MLRVSESRINSLKHRFIRLPLGTFRGTANVRGSVEGPGSRQEETKSWVSCPGLLPEPIHKLVLANRPLFVWGR